MCESEKAVICRFCTPRRNQPQERLPILNPPPFSEMAYVLVNNRSEGSVLFAIQAYGMLCRPRRREHCLFRSLSFYRFPLPLFRDVQMTTPAFRAAPSSGPSAVASASPVRTATSR